MRRNQLVSAGARILQAIKENQHIEQVDISENFVDFNIVYNIEAVLSAHHVERGR